EQPKTEASIHPADRRDLPETCPPETLPPSVPTGTRKNSAAHVSLSSHMHLSKNGSGINHFKPTQSSPFRDQGTSQKEHAKTLKSRPEAETKPLFPPGSDHVPTVRVTDRRLIAPQT